MLVDARLEPQGQVVSQENAVADGAVRGLEPERVGRHRSHAEQRTAAQDVQDVVLPARVEQQAHVAGPYRRAPSARFRDRIRLTSTDLETEVVVEEVAEPAAIADPVSQVPHRVKASERPEPGELELVAVLSAQGRDPTHERDTDDGLNPHGTTPR